MSNQTNESAARKHNERKQLQKELARQRKEWLKVNEKAFRATTLLGKLNDALEWLYRPPGPTIDDAQRTTAIMATARTFLEEIGYYEEEEE